MVWCWSSCIQGWEKPRTSCCSTVLALPNCFLSVGILHILIPVLKYFFFMCCKYAFLLNVAFSLRGIWWTNVLDYESLPHVSHYFLIVSRFWVFLKKSFCIPSSWWLFLYYFLKTIFCLSYLYVIHWNWSLMWGRDILSSFLFCMVIYLSQSHLWKRLYPLFCREVLSYVNICEHLQFCEHDVNICVMHFWVSQISLSFCSSWYLLT